MKEQPTRGWMTAGLLAFVSLGLYVAPAVAHHSFAMYDQTRTLVLTGVAYQFVAQANHAELHFYLIAPDGKLTKEQLFQQLKEHEQKSIPVWENIVLIKADEEVEYGAVMAAMDQLRQAGIEDIGLITERKKGPGGDTGGK